MIRLSEQQMAAFQRAVDRRFAARHLESIRSQIAPAADRVSDADLLGLIVRIMGRARNYGLSRDRDLIAYVSLTLGVGAFFDRYPPFSRILRDPSLGGWIKMSRIFEVATERDWDAAAQMTAEY